MNDQEWDLHEALAAAAYQTYSATLVGNPAPYVRDLHTWLKTLVPGALVMETSTYYTRTDHKQAIGIFEQNETRLVCKHEHADPNLEKCETCTGATDDDYRWTEHYTWLRCRDGSRHRWYNADFIRIPRTREESRKVRDIISEDVNSRHDVHKTLLAIAIERRGF